MCTHILLYSQIKKKDWSTDALKLEEKNFTSKIKIIFIEGYYFSIYFNMAVDLPDQEFL